MSMRTYLSSVNSIEPIRAAVASKDQELIAAIIAQRRNALRTRYSEEEIEAEAQYDTLPYRLQEMIACDVPPIEEPGSWHRVIRMLATHYGLELSNSLPFNEGYRHYEVWKNYRQLIAGHITEESDRSLALLQDGRPLRGSTVEHDGCLFSWLTLEEVIELHSSLSHLDEAFITDPDYSDIHVDFVASLKLISDRSAWLFLESF